MLSFRRKEYYHGYLCVVLCNFLRGPWLRSCPTEDEYYRAWGVPFSPSINPLGRRQEALICVIDKRLRNICGREASFHRECLRSERKYFSQIKNSVPSIAEYRSVIYSSSNLGVHRVCNLPRLLHIYPRRATDFATHFRDA